MVKHPILIILMVIFVLSCDHRGSNTDSLSKYYYFLDSGGQNKSILRKKDEYYLSETKIEEYLRKIILPGVISYCNNRNFILVAQKPIYELHKRALVFEFSDVFSESMSHLLADSLMHHSDYYQNIFARDTNYWIIDSNYDIVFGPYNKQDYEAKKHEMSIPRNLQLDIHQK